MNGEKNTGASLASICVFCGSRTGASTLFVEAARTTGRLIAQNNITLVYGGGRIGLMGELASAALAANGKVIGVIPDFLKSREIAMRALTELIIVPDMHMRKRRFLELSDAFIALPGGIGTFEEVTEVLSWYSLDLHAKPFGLLNINNYFNPFIDMLQHAIDNGFMDSSVLNDIYINTDAEALLADMQNHAVNKVTHAHLT